jgi:hypothetical protein
MTAADDNLRAQIEAEMRRGFKPGEYYMRGDTCMVEITPGNFVNEAKARELGVAPKKGEGVAMSGLRLVKDVNAAPEGWTVDGDGWYVRAMRKGDLRIETATAMREACHFGFTFDGVVFVREPRHCENYDRGVITPEVAEAAE